jgi:acyl-CoA thioester hydrolase
MSRTFEHHVRVPYAHIDQMGFVYYANYFVYMEMARAEMLREVGLPYTEMEAKGILLPVVEAHGEYGKPAHFDDLVTIRTTCETFKGPRLVVSYVLLRGEEELMTGYTHHVCMSAEGKVMRPPEFLKRLITPPETS